jgi:hypothetical protein
MNSHIISQWISDYVFESFKNFRLLNSYLKIDSRKRIIMNSKRQVLFCFFWIWLTKFLNKIRRLLNNSFTEINIIIIITISLRSQNAKRELRTKIKKYLHRVNIVENSKTFALLLSTIALLDEARSTTTNSLIVNDSILHSILQSMQTTIKQLQKNDSQFKSKNYTKILRIVFEFVIKSVVANKSINFKTTKQIREFTILIINDVERKILKIMIIKNIMNKL